MVHVFRMRRSNFRIGVSLLVLSMSMAILIGIGDHLDKSGQPRLWPILLIWFLFTVLAGWLVLEYHRSRLLIGAKSLLLRGAVRTTRIEFQDVRRAKWHRSDRLRMSTTSGRLTVPVSQFPVNQQERLLGLLHDRVASGVEEGWEETRCCLERKRHDSKNKHPTHGLLRRLWLPLFVPIPAGAIAGTVFHFMYGYPPELGRQASLVLEGIRVGCMASLFLLVFFGWQIWVEWPES